MTVNITGRKSQFAKLCGVASVMGLKVLESEIITGIRKSKYDTTGETWYLTLTGDSLKEMQILSGEFTLLNNVSILDMIFDFKRSVASKVNDRNKEGTDNV